LHWYWRPKQGNKTPHTP